MLLKGIVNFGWALYRLKRRILENMVIIAIANKRTVFHLNSPAKPAFTKHSINPRLPSVGLTFTGSPASSKTIEAKPIPREDSWSESSCQARISDRRMIVSHTSAHPE
jgi:hypothetical protein